MFAAQLFQPAGRLLRLFKAEAAGIQHRLQRQFARRDRHNAGIGVQAGQQRHHFALLGWRQQIGLTDQDHVAELNLLNQQIRHAAQIVLAQALAGLLQALRLLVLLDEIHPVDHRHQGIQPGELRQAFALSSSKVKVSATGSGSEMPLDSISR